MSEAPEGYRSLPGLSPAVDHIGPFYYRKTAQGLLLGFAAEAHHCNAIGTVHGGVLMCFADDVATMLALSGVREKKCTTVSFNSEFISAAKQGDWVEGRGEVVRRGGTLIFVRGELLVEERVVMTFQSVLRRLGKAA